MELWEGANQNDSFSANPQLLQMCGSLPFKLRVDLGFVIHHRTPSPSPIPSLYTFILLLWRRETALSDRGIPSFVIWEAEFYVLSQLSTIAMITTL